ncbi:MAG TPA: YceH family protein [Bryobacteraceae bacterium]|nr:YceH family protein [Bryobacteraceae bacterium]
MASLILDEIEARVLGCLIEKDLTTPDYYPLSLNALVNACNQKSNREPATNYDEQTVLDAIDRLRHKSLATVTTGSEHRVPKYGHRAYETLDLGRREIAVLTPMLLRGAQTLNELKVRTERMYSFDDTDAVLSAIHKLAAHEGGPFAVELPRQTGMRETRYTHLFFGEPAMPPAAHEPAGVPAPREDRLAKLEAEVEALKAQFAEFRKQFE